MSENLDATVETETDIVMPGQADQSEEVETISDSSPDSGENHEPKHNKVQERINQITADKYKAQREADELKAKIAELESKPAEKVEAKPDYGSAPSLPEDIYDEEAMRKYYADSAEYNQKVATKAAQSTFEQQQKGISEKAENDRRKAVVDEYAKNAIRDGVDMDKLRLAEQTINQAGINPQLVEYIMNDTNAAKIIETLYDDPNLMQEVLSSDPITAGMKIATTVKPMALSKTPKVSNAPAPVPEIKGGGVHEQDEFEKNYPGVQFI